MTYQCELIEKEAQPVISIRVHTPVDRLPQVIGEAYDALMRFAAEQGEELTGPPYAAYHNMDMENLDVEMGFPVSRELPGTGQIQSNVIPAGNYAVCLHTGPYREAEQAYAELTEWVIKNNYEPTGIVYEIYLNDPNETPEDQLQEQILYQLK